jgi:hypothetical protein
MASWSSKPPEDAFISVTVGLRIRHKTNSSLIALSAAALMGLLYTSSVVNVELELQTKKHKHVLILPVINPKKSGGDKLRNIFMNEISFTRRKSDVRQGATDRGSASIANLVFFEIQLL